ncbi:hypothetical protein FIBSPDRAFT_859892 [Athelia psychrophila]|uniref:Uncharacterized protein n=1 Tax=Athelia psychrophila TaxID=1759441 RepID=A0A166KLZ5_9AGAM|nr:hypothetical protein FIBSPDRAFT_859892 [Fibularhizoctonia sp. CBS 109695]
MADAQKTPISLLVCICALYFGNRTRLESFVFMCVPTGTACQYQWLWWWKVLRETQVDV